MKKHIFVYRILSILFLVLPTTIYLFILIPLLTEEYNALMASGGILGGTGLYASSKIPETWKYSSLFKFATKSFTMLAVITLIEEFIYELIGLACVFLVSYIVYKLLEEKYKDERRRRENSELATEVARNVIEASK